MHSGVWGPLLAHLAKRHRVYAVDLPGHGCSRPVDPFTLDGIVDALAATFDDDAASAFGAGLVARRDGRACAGRGAHSERVARLVLVCTTPRFVAAPDWPHATPASTLVRFGDELHVAWKETVQRFLALQINGSEHARTVLAALADAALRARRAVADGCSPPGSRCCRATDLREEVGAIGRPALVVAGSRDTLTPAAAGEWLAAALPHGRFVSIEGAAHTPFLSHREAFATALDDFLDVR